MEKRWYLSTLDIINELPEDERSFFYQNHTRKNIPKTALSSLRATRAI